MQVFLKRRISRGVSANLGDGLWRRLRGAGRHGARIERTRAIVEALLAETGRPGTQAGEGQACEYLEGKAVAMAVPGFSVTDLRHRLGAN